MILKKYQFIISMALVVFIAGCLGENLENEVHNPPFTLDDVPINGQIKCTGDPNLDQGQVYVFELPAVEKGGDSVSDGDSGAILGELPKCESILITNIQWSQWDERYYIYIEHNDIKGWVSETQVTINR